MQNGLDDFSCFHSRRSGCRPKIHLKAYIVLNQSYNSDQNPRKEGEIIDGIRRIEKIMESR